MRSAYCTLRFSRGYGGHGFGSPSNLLRRVRLSRPRDRMSSERRRAMGKIGKGRAQLDPIWRENRDVRSGLWPKPWMAKAKGPSAHAVGQAGEPKAPDVSRANKRGRRPLVHFLKRAGLSKVTRPSPKGGRNPFEASGLASRTAKPCHQANRSSGVRPNSPNITERTITPTG
jgi:hypothetical protein